MLLFRLILLDEATKLKNSKILNWSKNIWIKFPFYTKKMVSASFGWIVLGRIMDFGSLGRILRRIEKIEYFKIFYVLNLWSEIFTWFFKRKDNPIQIPNIKLFNYFLCFKFSFIPKTATNDWNFVKIFFIFKFGAKMINFNIRFLIRILAHKFWVFY
jgi:hypothetical protein